MGSLEDPAMQKVPKKPWVETPLIESKPLSREAGCRIFLKLENLQPSGSFKSRAVGNLVFSHASDPANAGKQLHFFIPSAGNAGLAAATSARALDCPCTVAMPTSIKPLMVSKLREAGAIVVQSGATIESAASHMREIMDELRGQKVDGQRPIVPIELHPFDHERIWEGVSSMVDEMAYQLPAPEEGEEEEEEIQSPRPMPVDAIICSVGGGGLMNGIIKGIQRQSKMSRSHQIEAGFKRDIQIVATETRGASALSQAIDKGSLVSLSGITSMATSLGATRVASQTLDNALHPPPGVKVHSLVMNDSDAARGSLWLADEQKILVEPACGVSIEAARWHSDTNGTNGCNGVATDEHADANPSLASYLSQIIPNFGPKSRVAIIVCGGSNISLEMATEWRDRLNDGWEGEA